MTTQPTPSEDRTFLGEMILHLVGVALATIMVYHVVASHDWNWLAAQIGFPTGGLS